MKRAVWTMLLASFFLTACATGEVKPKRICPQVAIVRALEKAADHGQEAMEPANLVSVAAMQKIEGACDYSDKGVAVDFTLTMFAQKGPRLGGDRASFPFFASIVDAAGKVKAKELMTAEFTFSSDKNVAEYKQPLHIFIPLAVDEDASTIRVLTGFQLTEAQLKAVTK